MSVIKGSFVSVWEEGTIQTQATLDTHTGEVTAKTVDTNDLGCLEREYFEGRLRRKSLGKLPDPDDTLEYEVCTVCHEYILTTKMVPGVGKTLVETKVCSNPDCESRD